MKEDLAIEYGELVYSTTKKLGELVPKIKENCSEEESTQHIEKVAHILTLNFDILDLLGKEYPQLNPYEKSGK